MTYENNAFEREDENTNENINETSDDNNNVEEIKVYEEVSEEVIAEPVTEANEEVPETKNNYSDGAYYTASTVSGTSDGYEWDATKNPENEEKKKKKNDRGFKIFLCATLSVFTISVVVLAIFAASYFFEDKKDTHKKASDNISTSENFDCLYISDEKKTILDHVIFAYNDSTLTLRYTVSYIENVDINENIPLYETYVW